MPITCGWGRLCAKAHLERGAAAACLPCQVSVLRPDTSPRRKQRRATLSPCPLMWTGSAATGVCCAGDKCLFGFVLATLWWQLGGDYSSSNVLNIAGIINFWVTMPAFG